MAWLITCKYAFHVTLALCVVHAQLRMNLQLGCIHPGIAVYVCLELIQMSTCECSGVQLMTIILPHFERTCTFMWPYGLCMGHSTLPIPLCHGVSAAV